MCICLSVCACSWQIDLSKAEQYWDGGFRRILNLFMSCNVPKFLQLAGNTHWPIGSLIWLKTHRHQSDHLPSGARTANQITCLTENTQTPIRSLAWQSMHGQLDHLSERAQTIRSIALKHAESDSVRHSTQSQSDHMSDREQMANYIPSTHGQSDC